MDVEAARTQLQRLAEMAAGRSGLDFLTEWIEKQEPLPLGQHIGMRLIEAEAGRVRFSLQPSYLLCNPTGHLHGGIFGLLLDSCMGCAVWSRCQAGSGYTTMEYKVNIVRALKGDSDEICGEGQVLHFGRRTATAEGKVVDSQGRLLAHGSTTCILLGDLAVPQGKPRAG